MTTLEKRKFAEEWWTWSFDGSCDIRLSNSNTFINKGTVGTVFDEECLMVDYGIVLEEELEFSFDETGGAYGG